MINAVLETGKVSLVGNAEELLMEYMMLTKSIVGVLSKHIQEEDARMLVTECFNVGLMNPNDADKYIDGKMKELFSDLVTNAFNQAMKDK